MKKLYTSSQHRAYIRIRQAHEQHRKDVLERRRLGPGLVEREKRAVIMKRLAKIKPIYLVAPEKFSFIENPDQFSEFLIQVHEALGERKSIEVDHEKVTLQTPEALTAFLSVLADPRYKDTLHQGFIPKDPLQRKMFLDSGLCEYLKIPNQLRPPSPSGNIQKRKNYKVSPKTAYELKQFAMMRLYGADRAYPPLYRTFIELMANTHNHAGGSSDNKERWFASAYCQAEHGKTCFTFVDNGVGIFKSVSETMGILRKMAVKLGITDNIDFLRNLLNGKLKSRTGMENRGKGIPMINQLAENRKIENLVVITNDVWANVSSGEFRRLAKGFSGTLWYWEVKRQAVNS
ncbi:MAG: hypothetical protein JNM09_19205 [Blastocatellia bacterium]|nr:hypothetical protein [Blastocatellia bacterium]